MITAIIQSLRPKQWMKNLFVLVALVFTQQFMEQEATLRALLGFLLFCFLSGCVYIMNDIMDLEADRQHPIKKNRPIASGKLPISTAIVTFLIFSFGSLLVAYTVLGSLFLIIALIYLLQNVLYSKALKHIVILDVLTIAIGFVLRAMAGAAAIDVRVSNWLLLCTILLSLFLALSKRRHEIVLLDDNASEHRAILKEYSPYFLDQLIGVVTASTLMAYALYTMDPVVQKELGTNHLVFTTPFVIYGIFRFLYLVHQKELGGDTSEIIVTDKPFTINICLWGVSVIFFLSIGN